MGLADGFAALEQSGGVMKRLSASFIVINKTDKQRHVPHPRVKLLEDLEILRDETRFEDEVLRRIPRNRQFRCENQLCTGRSETLVSADDLLKIAAQIPHGWVNLSKTNLHAALRRLCATQSAAILFSCSLCFAPRDDVELVYPVGYSPDCAVAVFAKKEAAIFSDGDSDRAAPDVPFGLDEAGNEIFILAACFAG